MEKNVLHTEMIQVGNRTYFFDQKQSENGADYLVLSKIVKKEDNTTDRYSMTLFEADLTQFSQALMRSMLRFNSKRDGNNGEYYRPSEAKLEEIRKEYPKAYTPWSKEDELALEVWAGEGHSTAEMAAHFQRGERAIELKIEKLGLTTA